jgi:hypothetical protein
MTGMRAIFGVSYSSRFVAFAVFVLACGCQRSGPPVPESATLPGPADTAARAQESADDAANVVRAYYRAINERRYGDAYRLWSSDGAASGKTLEVFGDGFASTASVDVVLGTPGPIGAAAGSRYVEIPVRIHAVTTAGRRQAFSGMYTLRRSVVDGATPEQRAWRIYSAKIRAESP